MLSVRLVNADSYQAQPLPQLDPTFSEFRGSEIKHVPIIRIFGSTSNGQKTCLHIHGVFPYLYVPYTGEEDPTGLAYRLAASLDAAINVSLGSATSNTQHVYLIQHVSGIPFYGYHRKEHQYLKIYFYNPAMIKRAADLLQNGSVLNQSLQPHEAHIPYILQFMMDYNVYGMSFVNLRSAKRRRLTPTLVELTSSGQSTTSENSDTEYLPATIERQSTCELEIDAFASDIMNRREIESGLELNPGLAAIWEEERARRVQAGFQGGDSQLVNPKSPPRPTFRPTDNDIYQQQRLARRLLTISQCDESTVSTTSNQSIAYAAEVKEGENLLNSSNLLFSNPTAEKTLLVDRDDRTLASRTEAASQRQTPDCSILEADDAQLVDLLVQLAGRNGETQDSVDMDSLLGSQVSAFRRNGEKSDNEEEDDDAIDLNLTSLQLDPLNYLEIPAVQANEGSKSDENIVSPAILSYESSSSSRSADEGKTTKRCQVPQYDGAGDVSPTLLNSDDEDNDRNPKEFSHLPEYNGNCDTAAQSRNLDNIDETLKLPSDAFPTIKDSDKSNECCRSSSPVDAALQSSILPPVLAADEYMRQYQDSNYEPLDRLLEIGPEFAPDLEGLHSSMEIGILLSSADSDSPESVDEAPEDDAIPLETVLNGDPCFTESAELDKSDLTELQDQYVSLLGNSLLPDVHTNLRIDSDLGNSSNFSDSDYQTGEKTCEILLNVPSPRSSITSRGNSSSSENVAPNIQEPEARSCTNGKFNSSYPLDRESWNCKDSMRMSTDNSDYNCNVVATWAELQNLQFVEKEKMDGRLGRSKERVGQHSQGARQNRRRASRRSNERAASQILRLDSEKRTTTNTLSPLQDGNNYSLSPRKIVGSSETKIPIKIKSNVALSPIGADVTILEKSSTETLVDIIKNKCPASPRVPDIAAEVEVEQPTSFTETETRSRLDSSHETAIGSENHAPNYAEYSSAAICTTDEHENTTEIVDSAKSPDNRLNELNEPLTTKEIPEGYSYYSSERSQHDYNAGGFAHWHCQLSKGQKILQDDVFTSDQVWVIEKRKRGRQSRRVCGGVCMRGDCGFPIVPLKKIVDNNHENSITDEDFLKVRNEEPPIEKKTAEAPETIFQASATDTPAKKRIGPKNRTIGRKSRVQRYPIDSSSSDSYENVTVASAESPAEENKTEASMNKAIGEPILENKEETRDPQTSEVAAAMAEAEVEAEDPSSVNECLKPGDSAHNAYAMRRRYSRKKRARVRSSKKMISMKSSRTTRNGLLRRVTRLVEHENDNLPGIPGVGEYRSDGKRGRPRKDTFTCYNGVTSKNMATVTSRITRNKMQPALFTNWESKREISSRRPNGLVNSVQNGLSNNESTAISPERLTINSPHFDLVPVSPIPKRNRSPHDYSKNISSSMNRSSTPKKIATQVPGLTEDKLSECVTLNLMMREVKSRNTRAKLKILLEKRRNKATNIFRDKETKTAETETQVALENPELPPISVTETSTKNKEIDGLGEADNPGDNLETSFETVTDVSDISPDILEPKVVAADVIVDTEITASSTLNADLCNTENTEASGLFESELEVLENRIPEVNHVEELINERKELSYQSDQFMTTIIETNFFSGNNYTIDAVSHEIPACLFEEDSNSIDKRSPRKTGGGDRDDSDLKISNDSQNPHDAYSDVSVDYRDLDVYDVESLTPSSSLATLNEAALDGTEMSLNFSETTESSIVENSSFSETRSVSTCLEKSVSDLKSEGILDSSFEEASPEFEALSPKPKICDLIEPSEEEFAVHSTAAMLGTGRDFDYSLTYSTADPRTRENRGGKVSAEVHNSELDHEIQDLVSQVVVQIENESKLPCESEALIIEVLEPVLNKNSTEISDKSKIVSQGIGKPEINKFINSAPSGILFTEIKSFVKESESPIEFPQTLTHKSELINRRFVSKGENEESKPCLAKKPTARDENYFLAATRNYILSEEELGNISKDGLPERSSKCRPVSIKLVNIDLTRFEGFRPKDFKRPPATEADLFSAEQNCLLSSAGNIVEENSENIVPVEIKVQKPTIDDDTEKKSRKTRITCESPTMIGIADQVESFEAPTPIESTARFQIPDKNIKIGNAIPVESITLIERSKEGDKFEKTTSRESSSPIVISDESESCEMAMPIEMRTSSQNRAGNKTKRTFKRFRLPARRSRRKCAEKTRQKLSQQNNLQLSSAESQPSAEESEIVMENDNLKSESQLHKTSENRLRHEITISESELNTSFQSLKYASSGAHCPHLTEEEQEEEEEKEEKEESSTVEIKVQESLMEQRGTENSLECVLSMQKIPNENKVPYVKWAKKSRRENSSRENSRDTSPEINASAEENTSADENVKPKTRRDVSSRKWYRQCRRKRHTVLPHHKLALHRRPLQKQAKIPPDSQRLVHQISSDKTDQENTCSLHHRLTSQNIADTNTQTKDLVSSDEKSEAEAKTLENEKKPLGSDLMSRVIKRNIINSQSSQSPKRRHRTAKVPQVKASIEATALFEKSTEHMAVKKSRKSKLVSETIVKEINDAMIFLEDDNSRNTSDGTEVAAQKIVEDRESRISTNLQRRDLREKITELRSRQLSPKKNAQDVIKTNTEGSSPEKIDMDNPLIPGLGSKRRRRTKKMSTPSVNVPYSKILPSQEENTQNTAENTSETIEEFPLPLHKIGEEDAVSKNSNNPEVAELRKSNAPLEKSAEAVMENVSQGVELTSQGSKEDSFKLETTVKATKKKRPRTFFESNVQKLSDVTQSIEENVESTSESPKLKFKLSHKTKDENTKSTILASSESSNVDASNVGNEKSAVNITELISQELELSSPKVAETTESEPTCAKTKKKGRPRKVLVPKIEEPSTESVPSIVIKDPSIDVKNTDISEKSESQEKEENYTKSKTSGDTKTPTLNSLNSSPEQSLQGSSFQKIPEHRTEPQIHVKVKKRGRPRKILALNRRKPRQPKAQDVDEKANEILKEFKLSQNLEQDETESTNFKAETSELNFSKPSLAEENIEFNEDKISKVYPNKSSKEDVKFEISSSPALQSICTDENYEEDSEQLRKRIPSNIQEKTPSESDFPSSSTEKCAISESLQNRGNVDAHKERMSSESESTPAENSLNCRKEVVEENTSSFSNNVPETVELTGRNRSRKRRPDSTQLSQSQLLIKEGDRDNNEDSQKPEPLSQAVAHTNSEPKVMTRRRGRFEKSPELTVNEVHREDHSKSISHAISETWEHTRGAARGRGRSAKSTDTINLMVSAEENSEAGIEEKSLDDTNLPPEITEEVEGLTPAIQPREKARVAKKTKPHTERDDNHDHDIANENSQASPTLLSRLMEARVETDSRNANKKECEGKISTANIEDSSQQIMSSSKEMPLKLSSDKLDEADKKWQTSVITKKRSRNARKSEAAGKKVGQELSQGIAPKITEDAAEAKSPSSSTKRTRSERSPEAKPDIFVSSKEATRKISDETPLEPVISPHNVPNVILKSQLPVRQAKKRVRFDEASIRECTEQLRPSELFEEKEIVETRPNRHKKYLISVDGDLSPTKVDSKRSEKKSQSMKICRTTRATATNLSRDVFALKDQHEHTKNPAEPEGNNGVVAKSQCTISSSDNASLDLPLLQEGSTRYRRCENSRGIAERASKSRAQERAIQSDQKQQSKETQSNILELGPTKKIQLFTKSEVSLAEPTRCRSKPFVQNQEPNIILQRLSRDTLQSYGFEYSAKNKNFVKILKKHRPDADYQVPAYDGSADFSSSESDDDQADVTVAREEKRVCVYQSGKKATNTRRESIVTPRKRKFDGAPDAQSPTSKHRAVATPGPSSKTPFSSPSRTSMLKSPGRVSGYYPPLQIIVTSPKVRKDTSEAQDADALRLEHYDVSSSTSACFTPRRKNDQRLHDYVLRGRVSVVKSPKTPIGDKCATLVTMGSQPPGELDEIKSDKQTERVARNISTITNECEGSTENYNFTSTLKDGKDVRKKLVFSTAGHERQSDRILNEGLDDQSTNLRTSSEPIRHRSIVNDNRKSLQDLENLANHETTALDPQPGPSQLDNVPVNENLALYEVTTDDDTDDDQVCNVTFTQYIDSQIEINQVLTLDRSKIAVETKEIVALRPKFNPPNNQRIVDTMKNYEIPNYRNQEPFFSNEADVPKQKELAERMLKVSGKSLKDVPTFISLVEGVTGIARWRKMKINELQPALAKSKDINAIRTLVGDDVVTLRPLIEPPTMKDVRNWLRARNYLEKKKKKKKKKEEEEQEDEAKKIKEALKIEIQGKIDGTEDEECGSKDLDLSVIEASPDKTVGGTDWGNMENCTLKMKLAKRGLSLKKTEDAKECRLMSSKSEKAKDSVKASVSGKGRLATQNSSSTEIDPSLLSVLEKSDLFKDQETSRHLGVSCGQIDFLSDSSRSNVANENLQNAKALTRYQYLTIMCLEVHVTTRGDLLPDAQHDSISAIFYSVQSDVPPTSNTKPLEHGVIVLAEEELAKKKIHYSYASEIPWSISFVMNEEALLNALVTLITRIDPEILIGWELETLSWGYVFQRATRLGMNLPKRISRIPATQCKFEAPSLDLESVTEVKIPGRIVLDIWRMMRHEAALLSYTFESVMHHVLHERVPCPSFKVLTHWWNLKRAPSSRWRVIEHYSLRVLGVFRMLDQLDIVGRTSELARLFGIQFYEVFSRGSQYRVESVMLRLAKPLNYIAVSPTPLQRASMRAMEALPLILEPESKFYTDPLIVLDFQSLYPSIIIAHNYCFSTCLGRIEHIGQPQPFEFGAYTLRVSKSEALKLEGKVNYAPCGVAYVKPEVRLGILPRMLTEILETRFMVKKAMKDHKQADKTLQRALHSRQHGLKFLANVTYGYTAANFSGRMPCIEVGDSVISKSKETLERAIKLVETTPKWGARVVYGDTDSLFILVPGKSKAEAFVIGNEIADAVTASNPPPIKLKFEKVMYPSILQTKKRYCGYMYETPDQETPTYLAKGIETVRRDGCPAVSKILEKTLKILFETKDVSLVKKYVTRQLDKVLRGKVSIQDLTFAKEFRGLKGYKAKACVPALELTRRLMRKDPRAVPRNSERVRYIIVAGAPNQALIHCVRTPWELIDDPGLRPNAIYYVTRVIIPPLNRCLNLMGVDVNAWYREIPHRQILNNPVGQLVDKQKLTIFQYFGTIVCVSCGEPSSKGICAECLTSPADTLVVLHEKLRRLHRTYDQVTAICQSCVGQTDIADCSSLECPVLYRRAQAQRELSQATHLRSIIEYGNTLEF